MDMRTPLKRVRGYGAAGEGTGHFWTQRLTAVANLFLISFFVVLLIALHDEPYEGVRAAFANPLVGLVMGLVVISVCVHMRLGMQTIIEDYVHGGTKVALVILNTFFAVLVASASLFAIVKMSFGA
ncbi:succinate dehydrogenase, hydrophobic membrane anchor protein [Aureimonas phyllosphaerae]|uniref:Succinate dehydrogenase hydrophobic membrane anchor subunit n=1 Tax=Aureimonas phyllosphaerae TaxID=1166078 RepID=A0A7W6BWH0_9HYPH|nr:succinate dehydrogenase, hydrophobic membrane anchor protein [Aureimonas phyllosphaerae]MBB3934062.1 succinate dehydrogenase / fumarate reductase membrane anchor subunit [Aureimonas phyllosphaerae]MBB3958722.1 succinate dehydrogenase / fumarate reductase membrane anchor subunit [Aureimonas phyllosphaerae]SFF18414.1 succinate dehydrogenase subunit D [Aureimonas phyllosphaerae]